MKHLLEIQNTNDSTFSTILQYSVTMGRA